MSLPPKNSAKQREHDRARILTLLLADDALTESLLDPQGEQDAALRDQTSELTRLVNSLPAADIADALESLPPDERHVLWQQVDADKHGQILVEASETVWDSLISGMSDKELLHALSTLDIDDQIYLGQHLPRCHLPHYRASSLSLPCGLHSAGHRRPSSVRFPAPPPQSRAPVPPRPS